jgi:hypothetical protein
MSTAFLRLFEGKKGLVKFDDLPAVTKDDIVHWLVEMLPVFQETAREWGWPFFDAESLLPFLDGLVDPVWLEVRSIPVSNITGYNREPSALTVSKYTQMAQQSEAPPILVDGEQFLDGGHRFAAAKQAGLTSIKAVDIGPLLRMNWKSWLAGETDETHPI